MSRQLLAVDLTVCYRASRRILENLRLELPAGEIFGLAGESGSGKSTLALAVLGLHDRRSTRLDGRLEFNGRNLLELPERDYRRLRGREMSLVLQSPQAALNPRLRIGAQLREAWIIHRPEQKDIWRAEIERALSAARLDPGDGLLEKYPAELSLGMAQRVLIAMAILHRPKLLIADEATSALDLRTQAEILRLLAELNKATGMSILFITHDLAAAATLCHRIGILAGGAIVETGDPIRILTAPLHAVTRGLVACLPFHFAFPKCVEERALHILSTAGPGSAVEVFTPNAAA